MSIKLRRAARLSPLSRYPRTWSAIIDSIPIAILAALTARQIAELASAMYAQHGAGHTAAWRELR